MAAMILMLVASLSSCISNDLPYPWEMPSVDSFVVQQTDAEGHELTTGPAAIDSVNRMITINLTEWANIRSVKVEEITFPEGTICQDPAAFDKPLDLSKPFTFMLQRYDRTFEWTVVATQTIERYFTVASQIGTADIDPVNHTVTALVPTAQSLSSITVRSLKLAGPMAVVEPDFIGQHVDFTNPVKVTVTEFGESTEWTITIEQTDVSVDIERVDAWTNVAWVYANAEEGKTNGFEYRRADAGDGEWTVVPAEWITTNGGSFNARLIHLESQTDYIVRATSDDDHSAEVEFTTGSIIQLPNSDFTQWWLNNKVWNPWDKDGDPFWSTGNTGAATLGQSNVLPMDDATSPTGYRGAKLETKFIGVSVLGKLGAGSLFAGDYVRTVGTNGVLAFGREFTQRPTAVKARIKYVTAPITDVSKSNPDFQYMKGQPDTCIVWCALADWDQQYEIRTSPSDRQLFSASDPGVIAYGQYQSGESTDGYIEVTIPLDYNATDRIPRYILLTSAASKYGDYFTGGRGATLYVESVELLYDYED